MKRAGNLFPKIWERENLREAFRKALKGKRKRKDAQRYALHLDENLDALSKGLQDGTYPVGRHHQFVIHDPKERVITAPIFGERVLHHAIVNICEPVFEKWLIDDSYACRKGRGHVAAVNRAREQAGRHPFFLKMDIRKYFDSISHELLKERLARKFKDQELLALFGQIIDAFRPTVGRGLPIGSLTSQHFANYFLGFFDHHVVESFRLSYERYMDDMVIWGQSASQLQDVAHESRDWLREQLDLEVKPNWHINRTEHGMDHLGFRIFPHHMVLNRRSRVRFRKKFLAAEQEYLWGMLSELELQQRLTSLFAFTKIQGVSSWRFRAHVLKLSQVNDD